MSPGEVDPKVTVVGVVTMAPFQGLICFYLEKAAPPLGPCQACAFRLLLPTHTDIQAVLDNIRVCLEDFCKV